MRRIKPILLGLIGLGIFGFLPGSSFGSQSATVDISVSIQASKDLSVDTTYYNFGALDVNVTSNTATPLVVKNESTGLVETYTIKGSTALSDSAGTDWVLAPSTSSTGLNTFALAAQFSDSHPNNAESSWLQDDLNKDSAVMCTTDVLGDGSTGDEGANVNPGDTRKLWFRIKTPTTVTDGGPHTVKVVLSVY